MVEPGLQTSPVILDFALFGKKSKRSSSCSWWFLFFMVFFTMVDVKKVTRKTNPSVKIHGKTFLTSNRNPTGHLGTMLVDILVLSIV